MKTIGLKIKKPIEKDLPTKEEKPEVKKTEEKKQ